MIGALRGEAQSWVADSLDQILTWSVEEFESGLIRRFEDSSLIDKILEKFLSRTTIRNNNEFVEMIAEVSTLLEKEMGTYKSVTALILRKVPEFLRVHLYSKSLECTSWDEYRHQVEILSRITFSDAEINPKSQVKYMTSR